MDSDDQFSRTFSREQVLRGQPPNRRARAILYQIESRTAHLVAQSRQAMELFLPEKTAQEREMAFVEAFALGRNPPLKPTVQDLERYAPQWADLVPGGVDMRAAVAHHLSAKYSLVAANSPGVRAALSLDTPAVQQAYQRLYDAPLESIYATEATALERLRWAWTRVAGRLAGSPPFWAVYALTLTETVGASILALPIALASIGPLPGIALLVVFGIANVLTVAYMAETASRSSSVRYGSAFMGQMVDEYLGRFGAVLLSLGVLVLCLFFILAYYIGFATTLTDATGVPAWVWVILLFGLGLYFVTRGSLYATVTLALAVGAINLLMIGALVVLAAPFITMENLTFVNLPFTGGRPFDVSLVELVFGVVLAAFFGHFSVPNSARVVLRQDPSGGALVRGAMAAQVTAIVINSLWVLAVNGAIPPGALAGEIGTSLIPLAAAVGPSVHVFGAVFVILGLGAASVHFSLAAYNLTREWLPRRQGRIISLPRRQGRLRLFPPEDPAALPQMNLVYRGLAGDKARFRLDIETGSRTLHEQLEVTDGWEATETFARYSELEANQRRLQLKLQILEADPAAVRFRLKTRLDLTYEAGGDPVGLSMVDLLTLPDRQRDLLNWMRRAERVDLARVAEHLGQSAEEARSSLAPLIEQGIVQASDTGANPQYTVHLATTRQRLSQTMAEALTGDPLATPAAGAAQQKLHRCPAFVGRALDWLLDGRGRFLLGAVPLIVVFLVAQWQLFTGRESFSGALSFLGVVAVALLGGVYPVLLLRASRSRGDTVPGVVYQFIGHPIFLIAIFLLSFAGVVLHGLVIWEDPLMRGLALLVAAAIICLMFYTWRRGAFVPRFIAELRGGRSADDPASLAVTYGGRPLMAAIRLGLGDGEAVDRQIQAASHEIPKLALLHSAVIQLPALQANEIKVLAHQISAEGRSLALPATAELDATRQVDLTKTGGQAVLRLDGRGGQLALTLRKPTADGP